MSFHLPTPLPIGAQHALGRVQFAGGYDRTPFPTGTEITESQLLAQKSQNESSTLTLPWPIPTMGFPITATATLRERTEPYHLLVELARGKINQLRNAIFELEAQGVPPAPDVTTFAKAATRAFGRAVLHPPLPQSDTDAAEALRCAYSAIGSLIAQFTTTAVRLRCHAGHRISTSWGCRITEVPSDEQTPHFLEAFNRVNIVPDWSQLESSSTQYDWSRIDRMMDWAKKHQLAISIGPLIDFAGNLPSWLDRCEGELPSLSAYFCDYVESFIQRYRDRISNWLLASGFNHTNRYGIVEDDRLRLVVRLLETARAAAPDGQWTIGLAMPWGDYLQSDEHTYSPLVFADTLLRSGLPISGFELELFAGSDERASMLRDGLEVVRLVDLFGLLGVPIDLVARHPGQPIAESQHEPMPNFQKLNGCWRASDSETSQCEWGNWISQLALSYSHVRSFTWGNWADRPNDTNHFGLIHSGTKTKPLLMNLSDCRQQCL